MAKTRLKSQKEFIRKFTSLGYHVKKELKGCQTVLDLGCGKSSPIQHCSVPYSVGVEIFKPYLMKSRERGLHSEYIYGDIRSIRFRSKSFDAVLALDVLEHLTKREGYELIKRCKRIARKEVIIFTPNGFLLQKEYDQNVFQIHKSGWTSTQLEKLGFEVKGMTGWKFLRGPRAELRFRPRLIWKTISDLTQILTLYKPKYAFQLLCIKVTA